MKRIDLTKDSRQLRWQIKELFQRAVVSLTMSGTHIVHQGKGL